MYGRWFWKGLTKLFGAKIGCFADNFGFTADNSLPTELSTLLPRRSSVDNFPGRRGAQAALDDKDADAARLVERNRPPRAGGTVGAHSDKIRKLQGRAQKRPPFTSRRFPRTPDPRIDA